MKSPLKSSIRHRIMLIFAGLMAAVLLVVWAINNWWLEKYYIDEKRKEMEEAYLDIDTLVQEKAGEEASISELIAGELQSEWEARENANEDSYGAGNDTKERTLLSLIREYGDKNNINMVLIDSNTGTTVLGDGRDSDYLVQKVQRYVLGIGNRHSILLKKHENYIIETNFDFRSPGQSMNGSGGIFVRQPDFVYHVDCPWPASGKAWR